MQSAGRVPPATHIDVVVVDASTATRRLMAAALARDETTRLVAERADTSSLDVVISRHQPDVCIIDVDSPKSDSIREVHSFVTSAPEVKFILSTASPASWSVERVIASKAHGMLDKSRVEADVVLALRAATRGMFVSHPTAMNESTTVLLPDSQTAMDNVANVLTDRELEVLTLMAEGLGNREIGAHLFISENTVKNHVRSILEKLNQHSRMAAVVYAVRQRILRIT